MKEIILTNGDVALVDDEDYEYLNQWKWRKQKSKRNYYVLRSETRNDKYTVVLMHRIIMNTPAGLMVDHIDHNGLNNQKSNLRNCTNKQNCQNMSKNVHNTSGYMGVYYKKAINRYMAYKKEYGKMVFLGHYLTAIEAAQARDKYMIEHYGGFASLNLHL